MKTLLRVAKTNNIIGEVFISELQKWGGYTSA